MMTKKCIDNIYFTRETIKTLKKKKMSTNIKKFLKNYHVLNSNITVIKYEIRLIFNLTLQGVKNKNSKTS